MIQISGISLFWGKNTVLEIIRIFVDENHFIHEFSGEKCRFQIYQDKCERGNKIAQPCNKMLDNFIYIKLLEISYKFRKQIDNKFIYCKTNYEKQFIFPAAQSRFPADVFFLYFLHQRTMYMNSHALKKDKTVIENGSRQGLRDVRRVRIFSEELRVHES